MVEGSSVKIEERGKSLILSRCSDKDVLEYGQGGVKVSTDKSAKACEASKLGSNPGPGPKEYTFSKQKIKR